MRIEVEEIAVGTVMRLLLETPGAGHVDLEARETKAKPDGEARPYKPRGNFETTGQQAIEAILFTGPKPRAALAEAFVKQGRSPTSINSCLHTMRQGGDVILQDDDTYTLSRRAKD